MPGIDLSIHVLSGAKLDYLSSQAPSQAETEAAVSEDRRADQEPDRRGLRPLVRTARRECGHREADMTVAGDRQHGLNVLVDCKSRLMHIIFGFSPNRVGNFWRFSLRSFVRRGRGGRGSRQPLRLLFEHPIQIRYNVSSLLSNPVRAFSMPVARSLPRTLPHLASPYKGEGGSA